MAYIIKIKRSDVANKIPAIADLALGELAMNTADGKLFMKKDILGVETIVEIGRIPNTSIINSGPEFPPSAVSGELFFRTDLNSLYLFDNAAWSQVGVQQVVLDHMADNTRHLTASQNALLDGLDPNISSTHINFLSTVTSPVQDQFNNRVVKTGDIMSGPLTLPGKPTLANQAATKQYVDDFQPFLNLPPRAGYPSKLTSTATVPVYADFKFSRKDSFCSAPLVVDDEDREVIYWPCPTAVPGGFLTRAFQSYRYGSGQDPVYNNVPIKPPCLTSDEEIIMVYAAGTDFVDVPTQLISNNAGARRLLIKTNGKSDPSTWTEYFDISENQAGIGISYNAGYAYEKTTDRILRISFQNPDSTKLLFQVFDTNRNKLGPEHQLFSFWDDIDFTTASFDRKITGGSFAFLSQTISIAYDPINEVLYSCMAISVGTTSADGSNGHAENCLVTIAYHVPKSTLVDGTGPITNLNPPHTGNNYIYWPTRDTGVGSTGMSPSWGLPINLSFDTYYNNLNVNFTSGWETGINNGFMQFPCTNKVYHTIRPDDSPTYIDRISLPDASPWAKAVYDDQIVIGDIIQFIGGDRNANYSIQSRIYLDGSSIPMANGTAFKLVPNTWSKVEDAYDTTTSSILQSTNRFTCVVQPDKTVKYYCLGLDRTTILEVTNNGAGKLVLTDIGLKIPPVQPGDYWYQDTWTWNGNMANPIFYYVISWLGNPANELNYPKIMTYNNGVYTVNPVTPAKYLWDQSNSTYNNTGGRLHRMHTMVYTETGHVMMASSTLSAYGGAYGSQVSMLTPEGVVVDTPLGVSPYSGGNPHIWYHPSFGYYVSHGGDPNKLSPLYCSRNDITGESYTEAQFFAAQGGYSKMMTIAATVGLVAYIMSFPLFLGGYYSMIPNMSVLLTPNANNYIYLRRDPSDRTKYITSVLINQVLPNSFSRVLIAMVVTDQYNVLSSTNYQI